MGVVNANPGSFSDTVHLATPEAQFERALALVAQGAAIIDVGTDSGVTYTAPRAVEDQLRDVDGLVPLLVGAGLTVSIDTYVPEVAARALAHGAAIVNDVSGLAEPRMARLAAEHGAALVILHTRTAPKTVLYRQYDDVVADVVDLLQERMALAVELGVAADAILLDPGIGYAKLPEDDLRLIQGYGRVAALGRPILSGVSRKYFAALVTGRPPHECLPETLATLAAVRAHPGIVRVHDVDEAARFLAVSAVIDGVDPYPAYDIDDETSKWVRADGA
jgi:dihydropteroate synthase